MTPDSWIALGLGAGPLLISLALLGMRVGSLLSEQRHLREEVNALRQMVREGSQGIRENRDSALRHEGKLNKHATMIDAHNQRLRDLEARRPPGG